MMQAKTFGGLRALRRELKAILSKDWKETLEILDSISPPKALISPLRSLFLDKDQLIRWRSISAFGYTVSRIVDQDMEQARIIIRQLMWTLNDESGGIGWGSPEAMGECMALSEGLCREYGRILLSYIREDGNYLEYPELRIGALWGIMRATMKNAHVMKAYSTSKYLSPYLREKDPTALGLALLTLRYLGEDPSAKQISRPPGYPKGLRIRIYLDGYFRETML